MDYSMFYSKRIKKLKEDYTIDHKLLQEIEAKLLRLYPRLNLREERIPESINLVEIGPR
jgi:hypothetical protein